MRQAMRGEGCRDAGKAVRVSVSVLSTADLGSPLAAMNAICHCQAGQESDQGLKTADNLANVGLYDLGGEGRGTYRELAARLSDSNL